MVNDALRGVVTFQNSEIDDLIIVRSDGSPTYNFCVVVDDALMEITHNIRGDDHLANTPKQVLMYQAMGFTPPRFAPCPADSRPRPRPAEQAPRRDVGARPTATRASCRRR